MSENIKTTVLFLRIYNGLMSLLYLCASVGFSLMMLVAFIPAIELKGDDAFGILLIFAIVAIAVLLGFVFSGVFGYAAYIASKPTKGNWIFQLILICFGLSSVLTMIFCIPLLIFWVKPELKDYYESNGNIQ